MRCGGAISVQLINLVISLLDPTTSTIINSDCYLQSALMGHALTWGYLSDQLVLKNSHITPELYYEIDLVCVALCSDSESYQTWIVTRGRFMWVFITKLFHYCSIFPAISS